MSFRLYQFKECSPEINEHPENQMSIVRAENPIKMEVREVKGRGRTIEGSARWVWGCWDSGTVCCIGTCVREANPLRLVPSASKCLNHLGLGEILICT